MCVRVRVGLIKDLLGGRARRRQAAGSTRACDEKTAPPLSVPSARPANLRRASASQIDGTWWEGRGRREEKIVVVSACVAAANGPRKL
jgi:hypothetical protein